MKVCRVTGGSGRVAIGLEEASEPEVGTDDLLVAVRYAALNPADSLQMRGLVPAPQDGPADVPGMEVAGVVVARGSRVHGIEVGERVFGLVPSGGLASRVRVNSRHVATVPQTIDDLHAAAIPESYITAHDALRTQGGLAPGDRLLVHGANGGVGSAAVQIGATFGATTFASARFDAAKVAASRLGAQAVGDEGFVAEIRERLGVPAVDLILETVGASHMTANIELIDTLGRIIVVGLGGGTESPVSLRELMMKRITIRGTSLRYRSFEDKATAVRAFEREIVPFLASGRMCSAIDSVHPAHDVAQAFARLNTRGKLGKVLVDFGDGAQ